MKADTYVVRNAKNIYKTRHVLVVNGSYVAIDCFLQKCSLQLIKCFSFSHASIRA